MAREHGLSLCAMGTEAMKGESFKILASPVRACMVRLSPVFTLASSWLCTCSPHDLVESMSARTLHRPLYASDQHPAARPTALGAQVKSQRCGQ